MEAQWEKGGYGSIPTFQKPLGSIPLGFERGNNKEDNSWGEKPQKQAYSEVLEGDGCGGVGIPEKCFTMSGSKNDGDKWEKPFGEEMEPAPDPSIRSECGSECCTVDEGEPVRVKMVEPAESEPNDMGFEDECGGGTAELVVGRKLSQESTGSGGRDDPCQDVRASSSPITGDASSPTKPEKRKAILGLSWSKEVTEASKIMSSDEQGGEKALSTGSLLEDLEGLEEGDVIGRAKRRLLFSTHLMQQLVQPLPIFTDAATCCGDVSYSVARAWLGQACHMLLCMSAAPSLDLTGCGKGEEPFGHLEELKRKASKLEDDFRSLTEVKKTKMVTVMEVKLEEEKVRRYSLMNHFAMFHSQVNEERRRRFQRRAVVAVQMRLKTPSTVSEVECTSL